VLVAGALGAVLLGAAYAYARRSRDEMPVESSPPAAPVLSEPS